MLTGSEMQFFAIIPRISGHFYIFFNENNEVSKKKNCDAQRDRSRAPERSRLRLYLYPKWPVYKHASYFIVYVLIPYLLS